MSTASDNDRKPVLEVDDVHVYYGAIHALKGVSLAVGEGEIVTLIGANGAGKSTTLRSINGLNRPREGTIRFQGREISGLAPHSIVKSGIAQSPEGRRLFPHMSVTENLEMGAFQRTDRQNFREDMDRVFELFPRLRERPSMGLAPIFVERIFEIVVEINKQGTPVLLVEQNALMALDVAQRGYVMETGRIALHGPAAELKTNEEVRRTYLGEG